MSSADGLAPTIEINTIGLIVGCSVAGTVILVVIIAVIACLIVSAKRRKRDRNQLYVVQDGVSPFNSLSGLPENGSVPRYQPNGYENTGFASGEFRPNPLAENPYYMPTPIRPGVSLVSLPPTFTDSQNKKTRLASSTQSLQHTGLPTQPTGSRSFYAQLYDKLEDTTHQYRGRPLYRCKRSDYPRLVSYFDITAKTQDGDWLVRPRPNVPNRPPRRSTKKKRAPKPVDDGYIQQLDVTSQPIQPKPVSGFKGYSGFAGVITTPFGAAERMPARYLSGSQEYVLGDDTNHVISEPRYTSLPRDGNLNDYHNRKNKLSNGIGTSPLDEEIYAKVLSKHSRVVDQPESPLFMDRKNPSRRKGGFQTIEESPRVISKSKRQHTEPAEPTKESGYGRGRSNSVSTVKSLGITDHFKFLDQYETEEERF